MSEQESEYYCYYWIIKKIYVISNKFTFSVIYDKGIE